VGEDAGSTHPGSLPSPGTVIAGKYRVDGVLGRGGMGVVLSATHLHLREKVAIKLLHASRRANAGAIERFMREARAASRIRGEHVVRVFDVGMLDDETPYLVMEHLAGVDLSAHVAARGPLPTELAVDYVLQACEALAEAHAHGIVHRDLKPANLFLTRRPDGSASVKVLDFGVSKTTELLGPQADGDASPPSEPGLAELSTAETVDGPPRGGAPPPHRELLARPHELTRTGAAIGSPRYMAPEQMASPRDVDARADIWSLGAVLFELVTGRAAFGADSVEGLVQEVMASRRASVREIVPLAPEALDTIVGRCLAVDRNDRFDDIASLALALAPLASSRGREAAERVARIGRLGDDGARAEASPGPAWGGRRRAAWAAAGSMAALGVVVAFVLLRRGGVPGGGQASAPPSPAVPSGPLTAPSLSGPPVPVPHGGECAEMPVFVSDGSVVALVRQGPRQWIERVSRGGEPRRVVDCKGGCWDPAPGGDGRVVYAEVASTSLGLTDVRSIALDGTDGRFEAARGRSSWRAGPSLFFVREDQHAIVRHAADGSVDETLVEAPSARTFRSLSVAGDGSMLAVTSSGLERRFFNDVCFAPSSPGATLDCHSAGESSSQRPSFAPGGHAFYFARGRTLVRFDPERRSRETITLPFPVTSLAVAPAGDRLIASTCEPGLELLRWSGGALASLPRIERAANELALGPHGEMAYPVIAGEDVQLVLADASGEHTRVLTSGARRVTEAAFSPDGRRVAFQDASKQSPGIFVMDTAGARSPLRLTSDEGDNEIAWLDEERLLYLHPSPGYAYGRMQVVSANGGTAEPLGGGDGLLLGVERAQRAILLLDWAADGSRFFERTLDGRQRELVFAGASRGMKTSFSASSVSGRYITWIDAGGAWVGDVEKLSATHVPIDPRLVRPLAVFADDEGRVVVTSRVRHGELYEIPGSFP
jgi:eukaryotic-like serine/threonine-protein kinase